MLKEALSPKEPLALLPPGITIFMPGCLMHRFIPHVVIPLASHHTDRPPKLQETLAETISSNRFIDNKE